MGCEKGLVVEAVRGKLQGGGSESGGDPVLFGQALAVGGGGWALAQKLLGTQADQGCQLQMLPRCPERVWGRGDGAAKLGWGN